MTHSSIAWRVASLAGVAMLIAATDATPQHLVARPLDVTVPRPACPAPAGALALTFAHEFAEVSPADHASDVWTGRMEGALSGDLAMTLELLGNPMEAANPVWKVRTRWTLTPDDDVALIADLYGTVNWKTGMMRLSGAVTDGRLAGAEVHVDGGFVDMNGSGTLRIVPVAAFAQAPVSACKS